MHDGHTEHHHHRTHEQKTRWVLIITAVTMVLEISAGYYSNSMALTADGWHMATHVFAVGLSWIAYYTIRKYAQSEHLSFHKEKVLSLAGFTSAIALIIIAVYMAIESTTRLLAPLPIRFTEAIVVASIGLVVNAISAAVLHHDKEDSDHNIRAAYIHVLADGLTSVTAIIALVLGATYNLYSLDALSGIIGSIVIISWAVTLIKASGKTLIEFERK
ncbi:MAG: cation diffusion facilitator family transporter [Bacteroidota bacterium]|nr:cation diffusion facilitator family transporter [Bacteroidota bacterium]MDP4237469.1 cation diffusion facilitator family transporter [Bacteroidota bacterium]